MGDRDLAPAGRARAAAGPSWSRPTRRRCRAPSAADEEARARAAGDAGGRLRARAGEPRAGDRAQPDDPRASRRRTPTRWRRSSACTSRPGASPTCSPSTTRSSSWPRARPRSWRSASSSPALRRGDQAAGQGDRALSRDPRAGSRSSCWRWRRSIACTSSSSRWKDLAATITKEIDLSTDMAAVAELKFRRGAVLEQYLEDGAGAVASYREALEIDPSHVGARTALQAYLSSSDGELQRAAVKVLEPIYEANNDLARLVEVQRIKLAHEKKTDKRVDLLLRIGKLEGQLGNTDQAWEAYTRAVAESPASAGGARGAGEPGQHPRQLAAAGGAVREGAVGQGQGEAAVGAGARAPARRRGRVRREAGAVGSRGRVLPSRAEHPAGRRVGAGGAGAALHAHRALERSGRHAAEEGAAGHRPAPSARRSGSAPPRVWEEMLGNAEQAIVAWNVVLQDNPGNVQALRALDRLYLTRGEFRELADNLQRQLNLVADDPTETVALLGRLGALREQHLGAAGRRGRHLLEDPPDRARAPRDDRGARADPAQPASTRSTSRMLLEPIYKIRGDWPRLIGVYEVEARHAVDPEQKIALYKQIAEGYEIGLDDPGHAYEALGARAGRGSAEPRGPGERSSGWPARCGKLDDLVARYGRLVDSVADPERKNALYHKIARLAEADLGDDAQAAAAYTAALDVWPRDLEAANALEQLYLRRARLPRTSSSCCSARRRSSTTSPRRRRSTSGRRSCTKRSSRISRAPSASSSTCCRVDDGDKAALDQLERLYIRLARWNDLKNVYAKKAELAHDAGREEADAVRARAGLRPRARRSGARGRDLQLDHGPRSRGLRRRAGARSAVSADSGAGTTCSPSSNARPSWRRRPPRWCRCATASASCGAST